MQEKTLTDEIQIITTFKANPCLCCKHKGKSDDDFCYTMCVGVGRNGERHPGYFPTNQTYNWRNFEHISAEKYAKKIIKGRKKTKHRFPFDNFEHDLIKEE